MKEAEAKTKWCPMMPRYPEPISRLENADRAKTLCLASGCMAWRWTHKMGDDPPEGACGLAWSR